MKTIHSSKLVWITPNAEEVISYCARVSNPKNQDNHKTAPRLLKYCIDHQHWSIFEQACMCVEINTTRSISAQILRHRSFSFQEFSQRYSDVSELGDIPVPALRRRDPKNRQNSTDDLKPVNVEIWDRMISKHFEEAKALYAVMLDGEVASETARDILPLATPTRLYMTGNIRSWIHYINVRTDKSTQKEHRDIAKSIRKIIKLELPSIYEAVWS